MNLQSTYMGLTLKNPLVVSSSPISASEEKIETAVSAGAAAIILPSLFEEQIQKCGLDHPYFPDAEDYSLSPDDYFKLLKKMAKRMPVPIIGSLNGVTTEGWETYAKKMQAAGAQGLELNIYQIAADQKITGQEVDQQHLQILETVKKAVSIPVALKLSPFFSSLGNMAKRFDDAGVDALVMFNRFYQPDFNIVAMELEPCLNMSWPAEARLPLRWIAMLSNSLNTSFGGSTGVHRYICPLKFLFVQVNLDLNFRQGDEGCRIETCKSITWDRS